MVEAGKGRGVRAEGAQASRQSNKFFIENCFLCGQAREKISSWWHDPFPHTLSPRWGGRRGGSGLKALRAGRGWFFRQRVGAEVGSGGASLVNPPIPLPPLPAARKMVGTAERQKGRTAMKDPIADMIEEEKDFPQFRIVGAGVYLRGAERCMRQKPRKKKEALKLVRNAIKVLKRGPHWMEPFENRMEAMQFQGMLDLAEKRECEIAGA